MRSRSHGVRLVANDFISCPSFIYLKREEKVICYIIVYALVKTQPARKRTWGERPRKIMI